MILLCCYFPHHPNVVYFIDGSVPQCSSQHLWIDQVSHPTSFPVFFTHHYEFLYANKHLHMLSLSFFLCEDGVRKPWSSVEMSNDWAHVSIWNSRFQSIAHGICLEVLTECSARSFSERSCTRKVAKCSNLHTCLSAFYFLTAPTLPTELNFQENVVPSKEPTPTLQELIFHTGG